MIGKDWASTDNSRGTTFASCHPFRWGKNHKIQQTSICISTTSETHRLLSPSFSTKTYHGARSQLTPFPLVSCVHFARSTHRTLSTKPLRSHSAFLSPSVLSYLLSLSYLLLRIYLSPSCQGRLRRLDAFPPCRAGDTGGRRRRRGGGRRGRRWKGSEVLVQRAGRRQAVPQSLEGRRLGVAATTESMRQEGKAGNQPALSEPLTTSFTISHTRKNNVVCQPRVKRSGTHTTWPKHCITDKNASIPTYVYVPPKRELHAALHNLNRRRIPCHGGITLATARRTCGKSIRIPYRLFSRAG